MTRSVCNTVYERIPRCLKAVTVDGTGASVTHRPGEGKRRKFSLVARERKHASNGQQSAQSQILDTNT